jgi:hypothetical protein
MLPVAKRCCPLPQRRWILLGEWEGRGESYLDETNVGGLLAEALTADVEAVLADQTSGVGADAAVGVMSASVASRVPLVLRFRFRFRIVSFCCTFTLLPRTSTCDARNAQCQYPPPSLSQGCMIADVPLAGALAVSPRAGVPDRLVRHDVWLIGVFGVAAGAKSVADSMRVVLAVCGGRTDKNCCRRRLAGVRWLRRSRC